MNIDIDKKVKKLREEECAIEAGMAARQDVLVEQLVELFKKKMKLYGIDELMMFAMTPNGHMPGSWGCDLAEMDIEYEDADMADPPMNVLAFGDSEQKDECGEFGWRQDLITRIGLRNGNLIFHTATLDNQRDGDLEFCNLEQDNWQEEWKPITLIPSAQLQNIMFTYLENDGNWEFSKNHPECLFLHRKSNAKAISDRLSLFDGRERMCGVFENYYQLKNIDLTGWDTSNANTLQALFYHCRNLEEVNLGGINTSNCTTFESMFDGCTSLKTVDVSCLDTGKAITLREMFRDCILLERLDLSTFDTSNCENLILMFYGCTNLKELDLSNWDLRDIEEMEGVGMFYNCESLARIYMRNVSKETLDYIQSNIEEARLENVEIIRE